MQNPETAPLRVIVYFRTGLPTLDLKKQRTAVECYGWFRRVDQLAEFTEIEDNRTSYRPQLTLAISEAHRLGADLLIAEIDLLTRNVPFCETLAQASRERAVKFLACGAFGSQYLDVDFLLVHAAFNGRVKSEQTKQGIAAAKARGVKMGVAGAPYVAVARAAQSAKAADRRSRYLSVITKIQRANPNLKTFQAIADALAVQGEKTPRGQTKWSPSQVRRIIGPKREKAGTPGEAPAHSEKDLRTDDGKARVLH